MSEKEFIRRVSEFLTFCEAEAPDDFKLELLSMGVDPSNLAQKGDAFAKRLLASRAQKERDALREERLALQTKLASFKNSLKSVADIDSILRNIQAGAYGLDAQQYAQVHFKNFTKASLEEKQSLLADIELLKFIIGNKPAETDD